jgi:GNAT superfamily N-acetyltransferase
MMKSNPNHDPKTGEFTSSGNELTGGQVETWADGVKERLGLKSFHVYISHDTDLKLNSLIVAKDQQKSGKGTSAMEELIDFADRHGKRITLSPGLPNDQMGTTSRSRLVKFYKRFGFVENKGRNKDFAISDGMYREPRKK